jgi:hypothetical protein
MTGLRLGEEDLFFGRFKTYKSHWKYPIHIESKNIGEQHDSSKDKSQSSERICNKVFEKNKLIDGKTVEVLITKDELTIRVGEKKLRHPKIQKPQPDGAYSFRP